MDVEGDRGVRREQICLYELHRCDGDAASGCGRTEKKGNEVVLFQFTENVLMILHYFQNSVEITIVFFVI